MRKDHKPFGIVLLFCTLFLLLGLGCSSAPLLNDTQALPASLRAYKHIVFYRGGANRRDTGITIRQGEIYSILPKENYIRFVSSVRIGTEDIYYPYYHNKATTSGAMSLSLNFMSMARSVSSMSVDILVWQSEDWVQIADFLNRLKQKDPDSETLTKALDEANRRKEIFVAEAKTAKDTEEVKKELQALREKPGAKVDQAGVGSSQDSAPSSAKSPEESTEKVALLEQKLAELIKKKAELEDMKQSLNEEREKADSLAKELEESQKQQEELRTRLRLGSKTLPMILVGSPNDGTKVERKTVDLSGVAEADLGLERIEISVNNKPIGERSGGNAGKEGNPPRRMEFRERIPLVIGENRIRIRAVDAEGVSSEKTLTIRYEESRKNIWAVVIGINNYWKAPQLKYAVSDARAFYDYLVKKNQIPLENVKLLLNNGASLSNLRSTLGTQLKNEAGTDDMVIIYFAGHGATEGDVASPDGDGLEKYLLPVDADLKDLYASALPMREISYILQRIRSERVVFIIDSCYSGASGGRTVKTSGTRASISDRFLDRVISGRGMIIMTASGANEVSEEKDELHHGVFTYFLLDGLEGKADIDHDGVITVDEAYDYVSKNVPRATRQEQHPVKKGAVEGQLILGILQ